MSPVRIYRILSSSDGEEGDVVSALTALRTLGLEHRAAFMSILPHWLSNPDPLIRKLAFGCLHGATGLKAFGMFVKGMNDHDATVRRTAFQAFVEAAQTDSRQLIHGATASADELRSATIPALVERNEVGILLMMLADPVCRERVDDALGRVHLDGELFLMVYRCVERGLLVKNARKLLAQFNWADSAHHYLDKLPVRSEGQPDDGFSTIINCFWAEPDCEYSLAFFDEIKKWIIRRNGVADRIVDVMFKARMHWGCWIQPAVDILILNKIDRLADSELPRDMRNAAIGCFYTQIPWGWPQMELLEFFFCDAVIDDDGMPDLWAVGGLLRMVRNSDPYDGLEDVFDLDLLADAFVRDPRRSVAFLTVPNTEKSNTRWRLIQRISAHSKLRNTRIVAWMAVALPSNEIGFLDDRDSDFLLHLCEDLFEIEAMDDVKISDRKIDVLSATISHKLELRQLRRFVVMWTKADGNSELGLALLSDLIRKFDAGPLTYEVIGLDTKTLRLFLGFVGACPGFPYGKEKYLALKLKDHEDAEIRAWADERLITDRVYTKKETPSAEIQGLHLTEAETNAIVVAGNTDLSAALNCCLAQPRTGLCAALAARPRYGEHLDATVALLICLDPSDAVAVQLEESTSDSDSFLASIEKRMVAGYVSTEIGIWGNCWLGRWEARCLAIGEQVKENEGGFLEFLKRVDTLSWLELRRSAWMSVASLLSMWSYRDRSKYVSHISSELIEYLAGLLGSEIGQYPAKMLMRAWTLNQHLDVFARLRPEVVSVMDSFSAEVRHTIKSWINSIGVRPSRYNLVTSKEVDNARLLRRIRKCTDLNKLAEWCLSEDGGAAGVAAFQLVECGEAGIEKLLELVCLSEAPRTISILCETIPFWPSTPVVLRLRRHVCGKRMPLVSRYFAAAGLLEGGMDDELADVLIETLIAPTDAPWFCEREWIRLMQMGFQNSSFFCRTVVSPQFPLYSRSLRVVLDSIDVTPNDKREALLAFLEIDEERAQELVYEAARRLMHLGRLDGLPIVVARALETAEGYGEIATALRIHPQYFDQVFDSLLLCSSSGRPIVILFELVRNGRPGAHERIARLRRILMQARSESVRQQAVAELKTLMCRNSSLRPLAESIAWGINESVTLTGKRFGIELLEDDSYGHTYMHSRTINVTPLPILKRDRSGRQIVEGVILHELGHHLYHKGEEADKIWQRAQQRRLHGLLNLVADEHLERNLRAMKKGYGDRLRRLTSYAFQHNVREYLVDQLLHLFQTDAFSVLSQAELSVGATHGMVALGNGELFRELERAGRSYPRFFRALRMGLGNRWDDPKVGEALKLFNRNFRNLTMLELYRITLRLATIFADESEMIQDLDQTQLQGGTRSDWDRDGEGMDKTEVSEEVERILNPKKGNHEGGSSSRRMLNASEDEEFDCLTTVVNVDYDPAKRREYSEKVVRPARMLRDCMSRLGLRSVNIRPRISGRRVDRLRLSRMAVQRDPRIMVARQRQHIADLFLAVIIDCSGSMDFNDNIERARQFGVMIADAARGLSGVDARIIGFNDVAVFDAGTAERCAAPGLMATTGNNDAGALWYASRLASASRRSSKLLVMISDGCPTECSIAALRAYVQRLARQGFCCAQVALRKLHQEDICFPNYIVLEEDDYGRSVRRFAEIIATLVTQSLER